MNVRQSVALNVSPVLIRVLVGLTFLWAGLGKVVETTEPKPGQVADFVAMGVLEPVGEGDGTLAESGADLEMAAGELSVRRVHTISWMVYSNAQPRVDEQTGEERAGLLPSFLGQGIWPRFMGWLAAVTEILAALAVLMGLLTRFFSFTLAGVIGMAMWLTQVGPAILSGNANLGILPPGAFFDPQVMSGFFWQFALLVACGSLMLTGPGSLSLDQRVFGSPKPVADEDDDDE